MLNLLRIIFFGKEDYYFQKMLEAKVGFEKHEGKIDGLINIKNSKGYWGWDDEKEYISSKGAVGKYRSIYNKYKVLYEKELEKKLGEDKAKDKIKIEYEKYGL